MAKLIVSVPVPSVVTAAYRANKHQHPKLLIRGVTTKQYVTVPYAPSAGNKSGLAPTYARQQRPGAQDAVIRQFESTPVLTLDLYFAHPDYFDDVEEDTTFLETLAGHEEAVMLQGCSPQWAGPWYITDLNYDYAELQPYTNRVTRATAHITLTDATDVTLPIGPVHGGVRPKKPTRPRPTHKKGKAKAKFYVVRRGDTLSSIAARELHHANLWGKIASLNHIRNPNRISVGQRLRLP